MNFFGDFFPAAGAVLRNMSGKPGELIQRRAATGTDNTEPPHNQPGKEKGRSRSDADDKPSLPRPLPKVTNEMDQRDTRQGEQVAEPFCPIFFLCFNINTPFKYERLCFPRLVLPALARHSPSASSTSFRSR